MKVKTRELSGASLDWAVASIVCDAGWLARHLHLLQSMGFSSDWSQGGPIIQKEGIELMCGLTEDMAARFKDARPHWSAFPFGRPDVLNKRYLGPTPLVAAMRCLVAMRLGDEVEIPEELLK